MANKENNRVAQAAVNVEKAVSVGVGVLGIIAESAPVVVLGFVGFLTGRWIGNKIQPAKE
jgi:hypothetical protein